MASKSSEIRLGDLVARGDLMISDGYRVRNEELGPVGVPFVRGGDIGDGWINTDTEDHIRPEFADRVRAKLTRPGDVAFITKGTVGRAGRLRPGQPSVVFAPQVAYWRALRPEVLDPTYLFYLIRGREFQSALDGVKTHGAMVADYVSISQQLEFAFRIPDIDTQRAIGKILGTLDDKIELNQRMNETLEALARTLFESWFVNFDPVRVKAEDLIRGGILEIGDGYRAKNSELGLPGLPFIRAGDLNHGFDTTRAEVLHESSVTRAGPKICRAGDVAFTSKGTIGRFAQVTTGTPRFVYSPQVCFWRSLNKQRLEPSILYCWMQSEDFKTQIMSVAGQTDMAPYVSLRDQRRMHVPVFPDSQHNLAHRLELLQDRKALQGSESMTLSTLRDALLPRLISGELHVKDAETVVDRAVP
jgi:type I restriction enzyme S subunit